MAGASADCENMWQIGIDVLPPFRGKGLASCLVSRLAALILKRGIVPFYCTGSFNIPSQLVAYRSGFFPAWMCTYRHALDGSSPYESKIKIEFTSP
jgi:predicted GNAT family acetyltransferase